MADLRDVIDSFLAKAKAYEHRIGKKNVRRLTSWLNRFAEWEFDLFFGSGSYSKIRKAHGDEDFFGSGWTIAWWRELVHAQGGLLLGVAAQLSLPAYALYFPGAVGLLFAYKEMNDNVGSMRKRAIDVASWVVSTVGGQLLVVWLQSLV